MMELRLFLGRIENPIQLQSCLGKHSKYLNSNLEPEREQLQEQFEEQSRLSLKSHKAFPRAAQCCKNGQSNDLHRPCLYSCNLLICIDILIAALRPKLAKYDGLATTSAVCARGLTMIGSWALTCRDLLLTRS